MKNLALSAIIFCLIFACQNDKNVQEAKGKYIGKLYLSKEKPVPGDSLIIRYQNFDSISDLNNLESFEPFIHYIVRDKVYAEDLNFAYSEDNLESNIKIPDTIDGIALHFRVNKNYDTNNNKGYIMPLTTKNDDKDLKDKYLMHYLLKYGESNGLKINKDSLLLKIEESLDDSAIDYKIRISLAALFSKKQRDEYISYLKKKPTLSVDEYNTMDLFYQYNGEAQKSDSVRLQGAKNFPKSDLPSQTQFVKFIRATDLEEKENLYREYLEAYSNKNHLDYMQSNLANTYLNSRNFTKFREFADIVNKEQTRAILYNSAAWDLAEHEIDLQLASTYSRNALKIIQNLRENKLLKPNNFTSKQYDRALSFTYNMFADTYAYILFKENKLSEALTYQTVAVGNTNNVEINERYLQYLILAKQYEKAQQSGEHFVKKGVANSKSIEYLETAYRKNNKTNNSFSDYLKGLEDIAYDIEKDALKKNLKIEPAPDFTLMNLNGDVVNLSSLKGKTVVLDFWATWCAPCKASFPGMQKMVEKYSQEPTVEFLFIATLENGSSSERLKNVSNFIDKNNYSFKVLMDYPETEGSKKYKVATDYGITGIPAKIVIGPDSNIYFTSTGYEGNVEKLMRELDMMISLVQEKAIN